MFIWIRSTKELLYVVGGAAALVFEYVEEEEEAQNLTFELRGSSSSTHEGSWAWSIPTTEWK